MVFKMKALTKLPVRYKPQKSAAKKQHLAIIPRKDKLHTTNFTATVTLTVLS
jgi:hypothetical protein